MSETDRDQYFLDILDRLSDKRKKGARLASIELPDSNEGDTSRGREFPSSLSRRGSRLRNAQPARKPSNISPSNDIIPARDGAAVVHSPPGQPQKTPEKVQKKSSAVESPPEGFHRTVVEFPSPPRSGKLRELTPCVRSREFEEEWKDREHELERDFRQRYRTQMQLDTEKKSREYEAKLDREVHVHDAEYGLKLRQARDELEQERKEHLRECARLKDAQIALEAGCAEHSKQNSELTARLDELLQSMGYAERKIDLLKSELRECTTLKSDIEVEHSNAKVLNKELQQKLEIEVINFKRLQIELDHFQSSHKATAARTRRLEAQLREAEEEKASTERNLKSTREDMSVLKAKYENLNSTYHDLQREYDALGRLNRSSEGKIRELSAELDASRKAQETALRAADELKHNEKQLNGELRCLNDKLMSAGDLQFEQKRLRTQLQASKDELQHLKTDLNTTAGENRLQKSREEKLTLELQTLQNSVLSLRQENFTLRKRITKMGADVQSQSQGVGIHLKELSCGPLPGGASAGADLTIPSRRAEPGAVVTACSIPAAHLNPAPASAYSSPTHDRLLGSHLPDAFNASKDQALRNRENVLHPEKATDGFEFPGRKTESHPPPSVAAGLMNRPESTWLPHTYDKQVMVRNSWRK